MRKLLYANLIRWKMSRSMWVGAAAMALYSLSLSVTLYRTYRKYDIPVAGMLDQQLFGGMMLVGIVIAVFCSMFVGTEYSDGTIRNKMIAGHARGTIYLANYVICAAGSVLFFLISMLTTWIVGRPLFGPLVAPASALTLAVTDGILACMATAALCNFAGMLIPNKAYTAVVNLLAVLLLLMVGSYLVSRLNEPEMWEAYSLAADGELVSRMEPNPQYLTGTVREVCSFIVDLLPGGQAYQVGNCKLERPYRVMWCAVADIVVLNMAGIWFFRKKDLK